MLLLFIYNYTRFRSVHPLQQTRIKPSVYAFSRISWTESGSGTLFQRWEVEEGGGQKWYIFRPKREKTSAPKLADFLQNTCNNNDSKINDEKKIITPFIPPPNSTNLVNHLDAPLHLFNSTCATLLVWINLSHTCNIEFVKTYWDDQWKSWYFE